MSLVESTPVFPMGMITRENQYKRNLKGPTEGRAAQPFKDIGPSQAEHLFLEALQALKGLFKETEKMPDYRFSSSNN